MIVYDDREIEVTKLKGMVFERVVLDDRESKITFHPTSAKFEVKYALEHQQSCCECVKLIDVTGDLSDLEGEPILQAEVVFSDKLDKKDIPKVRAASPKLDDIDVDHSFTWSFYKFATRKGRVTLRFFGTSNGYYSEKADVYEMHPKYMN